MVHCLNHCKCVLTVPRAYCCCVNADLCCGCKTCPNRVCCPATCDCISGWNYTVLKKVCNRIFKEYTRSLLRERYTIFDGGNSINVRIHRSGSRVDSREKSVEGKHNALGQKADKNRGNQNLVSDIDEDDKVNRRNKQKKKGQWDEYDVTNSEETSFRKQQRTIRQKDASNEHNASDDDGKKHGKNSTSNSKTGSEKKKISHGKPQQALRQHVETETKDPSDKNKTRTKTKLNRTNKEMSVRDKKVIEERSATKTLKGKPNINKRIRDKNEDQRSRLEKRQLTNNEQGNASLEIVKSKSRWQKNLHRSIGNNDRVIEDLRKKVRRGEKVGFNYGSSSINVTKPKTSTYKSADYFARTEDKHSRADEAKACDYLRAQMEQRELCTRNLCSCLHTRSDGINTKLCPSRHCTNTAAIPCFSKSFTSCKY